MRRTLKKNMDDFPKGVIYKEFLKIEKDKGTTYSFFRFILPDGNLYPKNPMTLGQPTFKGNYSNLLQEQARKRYAEYNKTKDGLEFPIIEIIYMLSCEGVNECGRCYPNVCCH